MSSDSELISILMPVKNAEPFLEECIESILNQTDENWQLLAVDDGSSDSSYDILEQYVNKDSRIRALKNPGNGIIDALRLAYSRSSGAFITRMDADDKMAPSKLEILKHNLKSSGTGYLAIGQVKYFSEPQLGDGYLKYESWLNELTNKGSNYSEIYKECVIPSPCWMVHCEDLDNCEAFKPNTYPEDYDLTFRFYREELKVVPCKEVLHYWRDHPNRSSRNDDNYADNRFLELKISKFLDHDHDTQKLLALWGAGSKGKYLAKYLCNSGIEFIWLCDTENKIGQSIYGVELQSFSNYHFITNSQLISSVAQRDTEKILEMKLEKYAKSLIELYSFC